MNCRFCKAKLSHVFIDLQSAPAANSFISYELLHQKEEFYPLKVYTCSVCFLVQIAEYKSHESIFDENYVYYSSFSSSWLRHAKCFADKMISRFNLNEESLVVEVASNDGYLLQYFKDLGVPVLGIDPTANTAEVAKSKGINTIVEFFGQKLAERLFLSASKADLLIGNNVLAHVPDIVDFVRGLKYALKETGTISMEFPHLVQLIENNQFDTIYHEHFSYFSFYTVRKIFYSEGLEIFDVEEIPTHGGSLRIFGKHTSDRTKPISKNVYDLLDKELFIGINRIDYYADFQQKVVRVKEDLLRFLVKQKMAGKKVAAYGAAAKGNTLLNYCKINNEVIDFVVDANPHKQNKWLPASRIPVVQEAHLKDEQPDYIIIFPWNIKNEVIQQLTYTREWGAKFVTAIPELKIIEYQSAQAV